MTLEDPVLSSLSYLAERDEDVSTEIYQHFAEHHPEWAALMSHMDSYMLGRMMQDVFTLVMTPPEEVDRHYLTFEVSSHQAYGVKPEMFLPMLQAVRDILRSHLGTTWSTDHELAWCRRIEALSAEIEAVAAD